MIALVVDDSAAMRRIHGKALQGLGWVVEVAANGNEALTRLAALSSCDLLLTDWHMPEMDGLELVRAVRQSGKYAGLRILVVTSDAVLDSVEKALAAGADDFIMKPFTPGDLEDRIAAVMHA